MRKIPKRIKMHTRLRQPQVYSRQVTDADGNVRSSMLGVAFTYNEAQALRRKFYSYGQDPNQETVLVVQKMGVASGEEPYPEDAVPWCYHGSKTRRFVNYLPIYIRAEAAKEQAVMRLVKKMRHHTPFLWCVQYVNGDNVRSEMLGVEMSPEDKKKLQKQVDAIKRSGAKNNPWWAYAGLIKTRLDEKYYQNLQSEHRTFLACNPKR